MGRRASRSNVYLLELTVQPLSRECPWRERKRRERKGERERERQRENDRAKTRKSEKEKLKKRQNYHKLLPSYVMV